jgi:hypothetical protein
MRWKSVVADPRDVRADWRLLALRSGTPGFDATDFIASGESDVPF